MNLAGSWEKHADEWITWARASPHMVMTALTEGGDGVIPWLLAMRAEKIPC